MGEALEALRKEILENLQEASTKSERVGTDADQLATMARDVSAEVEDLLGGSATEVDKRMLDSLDELVTKANRAADDMFEAARITGGPDFREKQDGSEDHCN
jgi:hypothetical protein